MSTENGSSKQTLAYSFIHDRSGTLVSVERIPDLNIPQNEEPQKEVVSVFPEEEIFTYGSVEQLIKLLIEVDVDAWRALPEKLRTYLLRSTDWQYRLNQKSNIINLIINDVEIKWNGVDWFVKSFHPDFI